MKPIRRDTISHDSRSRDAALRRLRRTNRWLIAGSARADGAVRGPRRERVLGPRVERLGPRAGARNRLTTPRPSR